ncbi:hypothetical protein TELCIR_16273 [Teladorsagia circumcincta]|uniref:Protein kinase domain-containing protein n=1 Tax=Teladorsagia circumcincta TaxID=45464 RepID=A0A2G9TVX5_TELCI|nr:hypothetical protein TELCIR_16273 [Teladorsagia circumcincta]
MAESRRAGHVTGGKITILKLLGGRMHFTELIDVGDQGTFRFFIMELVGKNLSDLKRARPSSIHILDFGISRKYGQGETESVKANKFKGTYCYASLACHRTQELGPRDDCESWLYMLADFVSPMVYAVPTIAAL